MPARSAAVDGRTRQRHSPVGDATRRRLMQAAVELVAAKGYDAVSIRDITNAAQADVTAVHYHFGSKRDLVAAALQTFLDEAAAARAPLLAALEADPDASARDVARCLVVPAAERLTSARGRAQNAFVAAVVQHAEFAAIVQDAIAPDLALYTTTLHRALPRVPRRVLRTRLTYSIGVAQREPARADAVDAVIDYIAGGLSGG